MAQNCAKGTHPNDLRPENLSKKTLIGLTLRTSRRLKISIGLVTVPKLGFEFFFLTQNNPDIVSGSRGEGVKVVKVTLIVTARFDRVHWETVDGPVVQVRRTTWPPSGLVRAAANSEVRVVRSAQFIFSLPFPSTKKL